MKNRLLAKPSNPRPASSGGTTLPQSLPSTHPSSPSDETHSPSSAPISSFALRTSHLPHFPTLSFRSYQYDAFQNRTNGLEVWLWGRQTGKSFTLAAWAIDRLVTRPGRLVTILSNSLSNGAELNQKCAQVAAVYERYFQSHPNPAQPGDAGDPPTSASFHTSQVDPRTFPQFECMNYETRVIIGSQVGRIKILPANPRTARGFSGDLILDEFAFHENSQAIWEAAEPILSAHPDYLCRIASTPNGRHNMFYRLATDPGIFKRVVPRSEAWRQGLAIYHPTTRKPITPDEARALAHDKRAYDQNYECIFESENMILLSHELINAAEDPEVGVVCEQEWDSNALALLNSKYEACGLFQNSKCEVREGNSKYKGRSAKWGPEGSTKSEMQSSKWEPDSTAPRPDQLRTSDFSRRTWHVGVDVGRHQDLTVISVVEKQGDLFFVRAILRARNLRLPQQQALLETVCRSPRFAAAQIDMTGLGLGLYEYTREKFGDRIRGLNFASSLRLSSASAPRSLLSAPSARAPEVLALRLLDAYESKRIKHPVDALLREDLRKPERITRADGRVSIVATRSESGHADHFWSFALAIDAAQRQPEAFLHVVEGLRPPRFPRGTVII